MGTPPSSKGKSSYHYDKRFQTGGGHRISRETPFAQVPVHRQRRADRRESRRTDRLPGERAKPARLLPGHDESLPHGDSRPREDRRWRCIFPSQGQDHLLANEYGRRRELPPDRARIPGGAGALAGRGGERFPEAGRVIVPQCGAASTPVPTQRDVAAESTTNDN